MLVLELMVAVTWATFMCDIVRIVAISLYADTPVSFHVHLLIHPVQCPATTSVCIASAQEVLWKFVTRAWSLAHGSANIAVLWSSL